MSRAVVITGVGAVTPLGVGARTLHERWSAGQSGIEDGFGRCSDYEPKEHLSVKEVRRSDRFTQLALTAAAEALVAATPATASATTAIRKESFKVVLLGMPFLQSVGDSTASDCAPFRAAPRTSR